VGGQIDADGGTVGGVADGAEHERGDRETDGAEVGTERFAGEGGRTGHEGEREDQRAEGSVEAGESSGAVVGRRNDVLNGDAFVRAVRI
jgi:hypothetical protein